MRYNHYYNKQRLNANVYGLRNLLFENTLQSRINKIQTTVSIITYLIFFDNTKLYSRRRYRGIVVRQFHKTVIVELI